MDLSFNKSISRPYTCFLCGAARNIAWRSWWCRWIWVNVCNLILVNSNLFSGFRMRKSKHSMPLWLEHDFKTILSACTGDVRYLLQRWAHTSTLILIFLWFYSRYQHQLPVFDPTTQRNWSQQLSHIFTKIRRLAQYMWLTTVPFHSLHQSCIMAGCFWMKSCNGHGRHGQLSKLFERFKNHRKKALKSQKKSSESCNYYLVHLSSVWSWIDHRNLVPANHCTH